MRHALSTRPTVLRAALAVATLLASADAQDKGQIGDKPREDPLASYRTASSEAIQRLWDATDGSARRPVRRYSFEMGLLMLAMCGDGSTLERGPWAEQLEGLVAELCKRQWTNGSFYDRASKGPRVRSRWQAIATLALLECAATSVEAGADCRDAAERGLAALLKQRREDGVWGYSLEEPGDFATTAWAALAVATAQRAGIGEVPADALDGALAWLAQQVTAEGVSHEDPAARGRLALVVLAHLFAGVDPSKHETLGPLLEHLAPETPPEVGEVWVEGDGFGWISLAAFQLGGAEWQQWQPYLESSKEALLEGPIEEPNVPFGTGADTVAQGLRILGIQAYWRYTNLLRPRQR